jgi:EAL domain-containing protein (putative c-di-GMP-specific phosphodiesterase class I)
MRAVLSIGQAMGLSVVAEGVASSEQAELLRSYGCETLQGDLYSPPLLKPSSWPTSPTPPPRRLIFADISVLRFRRPEG